MQKERRPALEAAEAAVEILDGGQTLSRRAWTAAPLRDCAAHRQAVPLRLQCGRGRAHRRGSAKELADLVAPADAVFLDAKVEAELLELDEESAASC